MSGGAVQGDYIGTNAAGTKAVPNETAIEAASGMVIGGVAAAAGNVISGNSRAINIGTTAFDSIFFVAVPADGVQIQGNLIGVQPDKISPLPNGSAVRLTFGSDNIIGGMEPAAGNVIAFNGSGIVIGNVSGSPCCHTIGNKATLRDSILSNTIYANAGCGIDIGVDGPTPNQPSPNNSLNHPVIESVLVGNGSVTVKGTLNSTANTHFTLQYFSESLDLVHKFQSYLGSTGVTTDGNGDAQFSATFPLSDTNVSINMTATAQDGSTSEFSRHPLRLLNISTRSSVQSGDKVPIAGFIVHVRTMVIRALGPSLRSNGAPLTGALADPVLEIHDSTGKLISSNDNWRDDHYWYNVEACGLAPADDLESAIFNEFNGAFTAVVHGTDNKVGIALVEAYDTSANGEEEVANISTRGFVGMGDDVMIAGIIIEPSDGSTRIVTRALGVSLAAAGVSDTLADPMLELHDSQGAIIASNDDWRQGQADALSAVGLAPGNDSEAAIFMRLPAGAYTTVVHGKDNSTGVGLVEFYNLR